MFVTHYNEHRPHRALSLAPPEPRRSIGRVGGSRVRVHRRDRLGGVIHEYDLGGVIRFSHLQERAESFEPPISALLDVARIFSQFAGVGPPLSRPAISPNRPRQAAGVAKRKPLATKVRSSFREAEILRMDVSWHRCCRPCKAVLRLVDEGASRCECSES